MEKAEEYSRKVLVAGYDVNEQKVLRLSVLLRMCQQTSDQHLLAAGIPFEQLWADGIVFLIMTNQVQIKKMPKRGDEITIVTLAVGTVGAQFYRDFTFYVKGEEMVHVKQATISADTKTHKILRPKTFLEYNIFKNAKVPKEEQVSKFKLPEEMAYWGERPIRYSDLDINRHVNNSIYADILMDFLPGGVQNRCFSNVQINYINESKEGDTLKIYGCEQPNGDFLIRGDNTRGIGFSAKMSLVSLPQK